VTDQNTQAEKDLRTCLDCSIRDKPYGPDHKSYSVGVKDGKHYDHSACYAIAKIQKDKTDQVQVNDLADSILQTHTDDNFPADYIGVLKALGKNNMIRRLRERSHDFWKACKRLAVKIRPMTHLDHFFNDFTIQIIMNKVYMDTHPVWRTTSEWTDDMIATAYKAGTLPEFFPNRINCNSSNTSKNDNNNNIEIQANDEPSDEENENDE